MLWKAWLGGAELVRANVQQVASGVPGLLRRDWPRPITQAAGSKLSGCASKGNMFSGSQEEGRQVPPPARLHLDLALPSSMLELGMIHGATLVGEKIPVVLRGFF